LLQEFSIELQGILQKGASTRDALLREVRDLVPFIRRRLRQEVGRERLAAARGGPFDSEYANSEIRAFETLRGRTIDVLG
jgi:hypothetical protein